MIGPRFDIPGFIRFVAAQAFLGDTDGFLGAFGINNFYLYRLENRIQHVMIAWDTDNTFWGPTFPILPDDTNVLMQKLMRIPEYNALWYAEIARASQMAEAENWLDTEIIRNVQLIDAAMKEDVYKPYSNNSYEGEAGEMLSFARERIAYVKCALQNGDRACGGVSAYGAERPQLTAVAHPKSIDPSVTSRFKVTRHENICFSHRRCRSRRPSAAFAGPMTAGDRQRLVAHLEMTEAWLDSEVNGLSDAQLKFKMTPESWSVEEVVMHLAIAEPQYWDQFKESLARPVKPTSSRRRPTRRCCGTGSIARSARRPVRRACRAISFPTMKASLASFKKLRVEMMKTAKESQEDLRGRQFLTASQDLYQWFLMISTHSQRHIMQIREVKAHKNFPRNKSENEIRDPRSEIEKGRDCSRPFLVSPLTTKRRERRERPSLSTRSRSSCRSCCTCSRRRFSP